VPHTLLPYQDKRLNMNKIWIALAAAVAGVVIPMAVQARDEGAWDTTRAQVQSVQRIDSVRTGRDARWDSTQNNVPAAEVNGYTQPLAATEQWDSTRRHQPQRQQRTSNEARHEAGQGAPLICACQAPEANKA
jgi:hypothetical protein